MSDQGDTGDFKQRLGNIRHDMRTPVGHIMGYAEMLEEDLNGDLSPEFLRDLVVIKTSGERMIALIDEFLGANKQSIDELDLSEAQFQLRLQLNHISGYTEMLRETAIDDGREDLLVDLNNIAAGENRMLELVEKKLVPGAFDIFDVAAKETSHEIDGEVQTPEITEGPTDGDTKADTDAAWLGEGGKILVVDDDSANRDLLHRRLDRHGYESVTVESGEDALTLLETNRFDLILLDLMMPGISGLETLERLKANRRLRSIPVIMLTAADSVDSMVQCVLKGAEDYIFKPFNPVLLRARIGACLEKVRLRQQLTYRLKIFISSPGDVIPERRVAKKVIGQLNEEFMGRVFLVPVLWEEEPLLASSTFQAQIDPPNETDIYVGILWSRIGSPLPESILRPDGTRYDSGTAFEFEDAMIAYKEKGRPEILLYRKLGAPSLSLDDRGQVMDRLDQIDLLDAYVNKWFIGEDGSYVGAFHNFETDEQLEVMLETHLRKLVLKQLQEDEATASR